MTEVTTIAAETPQQPPPRLVEIEAEHLAALLGGAGAMMMAVGALSETGIIPQVRGDALIAATNAATALLGIETKEAIAALAELDDSDDVD